MRLAKEKSTNLKFRRQYLAMLACGSLSVIAGCSVFGSPKVQIAIGNNDTEAHTVAVVVRRQNGEILFDREVDLPPDSERQFEDALPNPSEVETLTVDVALDETTTTREFSVGGASGASELVVNIKSGGDSVVFVSQS